MCVCVEKCVTHPKPSSSIQLSADNLSPHEKLYVAVAFIRSCVSRSSGLHQVIGGNILRKSWKMYCVNSHRDGTVTLPSHLS